VRLPAGHALGRRISSLFWARPWLKVVLLLAPGLAWLGVIYLGSLFSLLLNSLYRVDSLTNLLIRRITLDTLSQLLDRSNLDIIARTAAMAAVVTLACAVIAFPLAYYMARYATPRGRAALYLAILMPLWSSYLVRVYSWKLILAKEGVLSWFVQHLRLRPALNWVLGVPGVGGPSLSQSFLGMFIVFVYIWLPYMILPLEAALERVPASYLEASSDLGARPTLTFRKVVLPLALPGLVAGSIFTFSLTLGDFIIPTIIGNSSFFIGAVVYVQTGTAANLPLAAAFALVPVAIMSIYLLVARRLGALEAL
jgi:putative spermidine/putrescine transport system permease protein